MKTISLELAQELQQICKEKGIELPESEFTYVDCFSLGAGRKETCNLNCYDTILAPDYTLDELMEWLFAKTNYISIKSDISPKKGWTAWCEVKGWMVYQEDPNPTNACAKLLIYLIKKGLI
jgi:hypothetical protein